MRSLFWHRNSQEPYFLKRENESCKMIYRWKKSVLSFQSCLIIFLYFLEDRAPNCEELVSLFLDIKLQFNSIWNRTKFAHYVINPTCFVNNYTHINNDHVLVEYNGEILHRSILFIIGIFNNTMFVPNFMWILLLFYLAIIILMVVWRLYIAS